MANDELEGMLRGQSFPKPGRPARRDFDAEDLPQEAPAAARRQASRVSSKPAIDWGGIWFHVRQLSVTYSVVLVGMGLTLGLWLVNAMFTVTGIDDRLHFYEHRNWWVPLVLKLWVGLGTATYVAPIMISIIELMRNPLRSWVDRAGMTRLAILLSILVFLFTGGVDYYTTISGIEAADLKETAFYWMQWWGIRHVAAGIIVLGPELAMATLLMMFWKDTKAAWLFAKTMWGK